MALHTLKMMARGGIHDHICQGFHRYSTDQHWHVPHFEKMLYDQGQLAATYSRAFQISGDEFFANVVQDILLYVSRDLSDQTVIPSLVPYAPLSLSPCLSYAGLMISGFAQAGVALAEQEYVSRAARAAAFLRRHLFDPASGRLLRSCYRGKENTVEQSAVPIQGFLEDYVFVIQALFDLYEASLEQGWLEWALQLQHMQDKLFWDPKGFAYFSSEAGDPSLLLRLKNDQDGAEPAANSVTVTNLLRAACYSGHMEWVEKAGQILAAFSERLQKIPIALPEMARATAVFHHTLKQVVICGDPQGEDTKEMLRCVHSVFSPNKVLMLADGDSSGFLYRQLPFLASLERKEGKATAYVCSNFACSLPVTSPQELRGMLCP
ncbi:spermatogenesis-associated protein 20 [Limosa lapponica baueri]|uniref:Spermatogenesis-associated protein 20 n=1 Tax=Limosa lapponica baueri TaxID=1758121 RepID=A0A2I0TAS6_LIMLA|nr:spermatogenesis-associated protein 20 [Limosa lapponica baueri]